MSFLDRAFAPYGENYNNIGSTTDVNFTGDNQDFVAGTFDTPNRELNPSQGRWISPDPAHSGWNAYSYTTNPNSHTDRSGLKAAVYQCPLDTGCWTVSGGIGGGNDEFDAIQGTPGTYETLDAYGNLGFGFDISLWQATENFIDNAISKETDGVTFSAPEGTFQVLITQSGGTTDVQGLVPDIIAEQAEMDRITSEFGGVSLDGTPFAAFGNLATLLNAVGTNPYLWSDVVDWAVATFPAVAAELPYLNALQSEMVFTQDQIAGLFSVP